LNHNFHSSWQPTFGLLGVYAICLMLLCCWIFCDLPCIAKVAGKIFSMSNDIFAGCHSFFFGGGKDNRDLAKDVSVLLGFPQPVFVLFPWFLPGICVPRLPCIAAIFAVSCFIYHLAAGFPYTQHICHDIWLPE